MRTTWLPTAEVPQTRAPDVAGRRAEHAAADGRRLLTSLSNDLQPSARRLRALAQRPDASTPTALPEHLQKGRKRNRRRRGRAEAPARGPRSARRILHPMPMQANRPKAFAFMNRTMRDQRSARRSRHSGSRTSARPSPRRQTEVRRPRRRRRASWRAFQLAFILMQLPVDRRPDAANGGPATCPRAELLFFPTGGGKTEAYLGLAAFTFGIRRLKGKVETPGWPARRGRRRRRAHAVHAAPAHLAAVPACDHAHVRAEAGAP